MQRSYQAKYLLAGVVGTFNFSPSTKGVFGQYVGQIKDKGCNNHYCNGPHKYIFLQEMQRIPL